MHWILATTQGSKEKWALENIRRQGQDGYLPMCEDIIIKGGARVIKLAPLFPRYVFVKVVKQWWYLKGTFGVTGVVMDGDAPAVVPNKIVERLMAEEQDGKIKLPPPPSNDFQPGDAVRIDDRHHLDPFNGFSGIYDGMSGSDRARVLMDIMGRTVPVVVSLDNLQPA